jgi:hypothetical protein
VDPKDFKPTEAKKLVVNADYSYKFDASLVFIVFIVMSTLYFLSKLH